MKKAASLKYIVVLMVVVMFGLFALTCIASVDIEISNNHNISNTSQNGGYLADLAGDTQIADYRNIRKTNTYNVPRNLPITYDGGLSAYPIYGKSLSSVGADKAAVKAENLAMFDYDSIGADGKLYKNNVQLAKPHDTLKRHTYSTNNLYFEDAIGDDVQAIGMDISYYYDSAKGLTPLNLYALPGELIKINIADIGVGMEVVIGASPLSVGANHTVGGTNGSNWDSRMPLPFKGIKLKQGENYVGTQNGGPIYVRSLSSAPNQISSIAHVLKFSIDGVVEMPHFEVGFTTEAEWERLRVSPGTYFHLDVNRLVLSMPAEIARKVSFEEMNAIANFYYKAINVSLNFTTPVMMSQSIPITHFYDVFVPAGEAVAIPGTHITIAPMYWRNGDLNITNLINNGSWGTVHEINHHFQGGFGATSANVGFDEVSNNSINAGIYSEYTNVSAKRKMYLNEGRDRYEVTGLNYWDKVAVPFNSMLPLADRRGDALGDLLSMYTTLQHALSLDTYIEVAAHQNARTGQTNMNHDTWFYSLVEVTGYDMTYYYTELCNFPVNQDLLDATAAKNLPMFVPVTSPQQNGSTYWDTDSNGESVEKFHFSARPYEVAADEKLLLDLQKQMLVPEGFTMTIKNVTTSGYGEFVNISPDTFTYKADGNYNNVGRMDVTVSLVNDANPSMEIKDVTIISEFVVKADNKPLFMPEHVYNPTKTTLNKIYAATGVTAVSTNPYRSNANVIFDGKYASYHMFQLKDGPAKVDVTREDAGGFNEIIMDIGGETLTDVSVYYGDEFSDNMTLFKKVDNISIKTKKLTIKGEDIPSAKCVRFVFNDAHKVFARYKTISLHEVYFKSTVVMNNFVDVNDNTVVTKTGTWKTLPNAYQLGSGVVESYDGEINFKFFGNAVSFSSIIGPQYGIGEYRLDGGEWKEFNLNNDKFKSGNMIAFEKNLSNIEHTLTIRTKDGHTINVDAFRTSKMQGDINPIFYPTDKEVVLPEITDPESNHTIAIIVGCALGVELLIIGAVVSIIIAKKRKKA